jgi:hypothetical protein
MSCCAGFGNTGDPLGQQRSHELDGRRKGGRGSEIEREREVNDLDCLTPLLLAERSGTNIDFQPCAAHIYTHEFAWT